MPKFRPPIMLKYYTLEITRPRKEICEVLDWCAENIKGATDYEASGTFGAAFATKFMTLRLYFADDEDAAKFRLFWS